MTKNDLLETYEVLVRVSEFLDGYVDVNDGDYGEPVPNRARSLQDKVERAAEKVWEDWGMLSEEKTS